MKSDAPLIELVEKWEGDKSGFLCEVESSIKNYVTSQGAGCLTIVERTQDGNSIYKTCQLAPTLSYANHLLKFCQGKPFNGKPLDSGLTDPIVGIVTSNYVKFYQDKSEQIAQAFIATLLENRTMLTGFVSALTDKLAHETGRQVKERIIALIIHQLRNAASSHTGRAVSNSVQHSATTATGVAVAKAVASLIIKLMGTQLKFLIIRFLSMAAVQRIILIAIKKYIMAAVIAAVAKFIAAHLGISASAAIALVLIPIITALIIHEVKHFPEHLGEKISGKVCEELEGKFNSINDSIVKQIFGEIFRPDSDVIIEAIAGSQDLQDMMQQLIKKVQSSPI